MFRMERAGQKAVRRNGAIFGRMVLPNAEKIAARARAVPAAPVVRPVIRPVAPRSVALYRDSPIRAPAFGAVPSRAFHSMGVSSVRGVSGVVEVGAIVGFTGAALAGGIGLSVSLDFLLMHPVRQINLRLDELRTASKDNASLRTLQDKFQSLIRDVHGLLEGILSGLEKGQYRMLYVRFLRSLPIGTFENHLELASKKILNSLDEIDKLLTAARAKQIEKDKQESGKKIQDDIAEINKIFSRYPNYYHYSYYSTRSTISGKEVTQDEIVLKLTRVLQRATEGELYYYGYIKDYFAELVESYQKEGQKDFSVLQECRDKCIAALQSSGANSQEEEDLKKAKQLVDTTKIEVHQMFKHYIAAIAQRQQRTEPVEEVRPSGP